VSKCKASCNICNGIEPDSWDFNKSGLWICACFSKNIKRTRIEDVLKTKGVKTLEEFKAKLKERLK